MIRIAFLFRTIWRRKLENVDFDIPVTVDLFIKLIELCVNQCYFTCNNKYYSQVFGLPMGSPLSPVLANLFMEFFESELLPDIIDFEIKWLRYVDDIFAVIADSLNIDDFLSMLNNLHHSIKFKVEIETNESLPFLDTVVSRSENDTIKYKVYRKPTHSETYIHAFSSHSDKVKTGVISNMFLRAYKICDMEFLDEEIDHIRNVFANLGYSEIFTQRAHCKATQSFYGT